MKEKAAAIIAALGGQENIKSLDSCITRLRLTLADASKMDERKLRSLGVFGIMKMGTVVQVVIGTLAEAYEREMKDLMK
ncbi:MAG: PTS transporter subunit EIIB [Symbiobacteriia bacterium]